MGSIGKAILTRWNGHGLDADIAELYLGSGYKNAKEINSAMLAMYAGTPETEPDFPRAEFFAMPWREILRTPSCVIREQFFFLYVWTKNEDDLTKSNGFLDKICAAYNNGHMASTGRFSIDNATVSECKVAGSQYFALAKSDVPVFFGEVQVECKYTAVNTTPDSAGS